MNASFSIVDWLRTRAGRASLALVVGCGLGLVAMAWRTFIVPPDEQFDLDFGAAKWIEAPTPTPNSYYRRALYLSRPAQQAWLQVAGSDSFSVFINGRSIANEAFVSTGVAGLYDLTSMLATGKNVIAISVSRDSYPGGAQLLVRGAYRDQKDTWQEFTSDEHWKVSSVSQGVVGGPAWNAVDLDDALWANARPATTTPLPLQPVTLDPRVLQIRPEGKWIGSREAAANEAGFERKFEIPEPGAETWLQVSASGSYELLINGGVAAKHPGPSTGLDVYHVTPWLHRGSNSVLIRVRPQTGAVALFVDGVSFVPFGSVRRLQTDESWRVSSGTSDSPVGRPQPAIQLASYGDAPWGLMRRSPLAVESYPLRTFVSGTVCTGAILLLLAGILIAWLNVPRAIANRCGADPGRALAYDALLHAPVVAVMLLLFFVGNDVRFHPDWAYRPMFVLGLVAWLVVMRLFVWGHLSGTNGATAEETDESRDEFTMTFATRAALIAIALVALVVRLTHIGFMSLDHDEITMVKMAKGIFSTGYPHIVIGGLSKRLTTYELVPYPIALSALAFGWRDWAMRLPALIFGTLTVYQVGRIGVRIVGRRAGVLAAVIWTFLPWAIQWSRNAFYPQQAQFFALLTFWHFYEALRERPWQKRHLTLSTVFFCLTYLSWEGAGFILPALALVVIAMQPGDWSWLRNKHFWKCFGGAFVVVVIQQLHRMASSAPYLMIGSGLSELGLPTPYFLDPMYDPLFYVRNFLGLENNMLMAFVAGIGFLFFWRRRGVRYPVCVVLALMLLYTNLLGAYASRYSYYYAPMLALAACGACVAACDGVSSIAARAGTRSRLSAAGLAKFGYIVILLLSASSLGFHLYRLSSTPSNPVERTRMGVYNINYRGASEFVKQQIRPTDAVIPAVPHTFEYYTDWEVTTS